MRLGKVMLSDYYVVDLDDKDQVEVAKDLLYDDMDFCIRNDGFGGYIELIEDPSLQEKDIHSVFRDAGVEED